jgi:hypothetical protein
MFVPPPGPAAGHAPYPGPDTNMNLLNAILDNLIALLHEPPTAAAALGIACAFGVRNLIAASVGILVAAGLIWTGHPWLATLVAAVLAIAWLIDCARYPKRDCLRCKGGGKFKRGFLWFVTSRECNSCEGAGRKIRFGTKLLIRTFGNYFV